MIEFAYCTVTGEEPNCQGTSVRCIVCEDAADIAGSQTWERTVPGIAELPCPADDQQASQRCALLSAAALDWDGVPFLGSERRG